MKLKERFNSGINIFRQKSSSCNFNCCCCRCCCCKQASFEGQPQQQQDVDQVPLATAVVVVVVASNVASSWVEEEGLAQRFGRWGDQIRVSSVFFPFSGAKPFQHIRREMGRDNSNSYNSIIDNDNKNSNGDLYNWRLFERRLRRRGGTVSLRSAHTCLAIAQLESRSWVLLLKDVQKYKEGFDKTREIFNWVNCCKNLTWFETKLTLKLRWHLRFHCAWLSQRLVRKRLFGTA